MDPFKTDPELLERFRRGESRALDRVYRAFARPLRSFVLRGFAFKSGDRDLYFRGVWTDHDLDDIVQETFRRAFGVKARATYDGVRPYKNYLFTIARNAVINDITVRSRQIPVGDAMTRDAPGEDMGPLDGWVLAQRQMWATMGGISGALPDAADEQVEDLEVFGLVRAYLETLKRDEARFFELRFLGQLSQERTARRMGWNRAKVRKLESRLRRGFLCHLQGTGYLERRPEVRKVRRAADPVSARATFDRAREIWLTGRAGHTPDILVDAA